MTDPTISRRERKKRDTSIALADAAWQLFTRNGYTETTILDITEAADVAERTFYRHYDCKEAVLFGDWRSQLAELAEAIGSAASHESPLDALRSAVLTVGRHYDAEKTKNLLRARIMDGSATVADYRRRVIQPEWEDTLAGALAVRMGTDPARDLRPYLFAGISVAAINAAAINWIGGGGVGSLADLISQALDHLKTID